MSERNQLSSLSARFEVISDPGYIEYRYYNHKRQARGTRDRDGTPGRTHIVNSTRGVWLDAMFVALLSYFGSLSGGDRQRVLICIGAFILYAYWRCATIIYESVIVFPPHGVQLETHRGPFQRPVFVARRFIPAVYIQDIIINEALRRWNVRYYLALIVHSPKEKLELAVFFENTLPHFPVLLEVYRGIKCALNGDETS